MWAADDEERQSLEALQGQGEQQIEAVRQTLRAAISHYEQAKANLGRERERYVQLQREVKVRSSMQPACLVSIVHT